MKKLVKAAIFNDIHFGRKNNLEEHNQNCLQFVEWFCKQITNDKEIDHVVFQGDWYENRSSINISTLNYSYKAGQLLNKLGIPVFFILGNHDLAHRSSRSLYSTVNFKEFSNFTVVDQPIIVEETYKPTLLCPFIFKDEYKSLKEYKDVPIWMGHFEFNGFVITGDSVKMEHGADHTTYKKQSKIFSGHFHKRQVVDNVVYVGSPMCYDYSDSDDFERGFAIYDYKLDEVVFVNWPDTPKYVTINLSELKKDNIQLPKKAQVRVYVDTDITFEESLLISDEYKEKFELNSLELRESNELKTLISDTNSVLDEIDEKELALASVDDLVELMIKTINSDQIDNDLLLSIYKELQDNNEKSKTVVKANKPNKIKFKSVSIKNFMSYGNNPQTFTFTESDGLVLIKGENLDTSLREANGCGKTAICNSITYALYDRTFNSVKSDDLINNRNKKNMEVSLVMDVDDVEYTIVRQRKCKNGNSCNLYRNGELIDVPASLSSIDDLIVNIIGMEYYVFQRLVTFKAGQESFFNLPLNSKSGASQIKIIEELFNLSTLTLRAENLKEVIKEDKHKFDLVKNKIEQQEQELARYDSHVNKAKERLETWDVEFDKKKTNFSSQLEQWEIDHQVNISKLEKQISLWDEDRNNRLNKLYDERDNFEDNRKNKILMLKQQQEQWESKKVSDISSIGEDIQLWEQERENKIKKMQGIVDDYSKIDFDKEKHYHDEFSAISSKISSDTNTIKLSQKDMVSKNQQLKELNSLKEKLANEISVFESAKCPTCLQEYKNNSHKIEEYKSKLKDTNENVSIIEQEMNELVEIIDAHTKSRDSNSEKLLDLKDKMVYENLQEMEKSISEIKILKEKIDNIKNMSNPKVQERELLKTSVNPYIDKINSVLFENNLTHLAIKDVENEVNPYVNKLEIVKNEVNPYIDKLKSLDTEINPHKETLTDLMSNKPEQVNYLEINNLDKKLEHQNFLLKLLTKKDSFVRKALLNKNIPYLNKRMSHYLNDLGLPHSVRFTEEMQAQITQFNKELSFDNLSAGQQARVNIALSFAFRDVIQNMHTNINMCMLDEVLDVGLSDVGIRAAVSMLKKKTRDDNISIFIISHRDGVDSYFDKILTVQMEGGFSKIL